MPMTDMKRSSHRCCRSLLWIALALVADVNRSANATEIQDLDVGHLKITEQPGTGLINVEARCVRMTDLIEAVANVAGLPVTFDRQYNTYVSLNFPGVFQTPLKWIDTAANRGGYLHAEVNNDRIRVYRALVMADLRAEMTASALEEAYRTGAELAERPQTGLQRGAYFYAGHYIPPPYQVYTVPLDEGGFGISINGLNHDVVSGPNPAAAEPVAVELPESGQFTDFANLQKYIETNLYPSLLRGRQPAIARDLILEFVTSQELVESVVNSDENPRVNIWHNGHVLPIRLFTMNYDLNTGTIENMAATTDADRMKNADNKAKGLVTRLENGSFVFRSSYGIVAGVSGFEELEHFQQIISKIGSVDTLQLECLLKEIVHSRQLARELAANVPPYKAEVLARISAEITSILDKEQ